MNVNNIAPNNSLLKVNRKQDLLNTMISILSECPNSHEVTNDLECLKYICNIVVNLISSKENKVLVIQISSILYLNFMKQANKLIMTNIDVLYENKQIE